MIKYRKYLIVLMIIAASLISVKGTLAYFTTYTRVKGVKPVILSEKTQFKEEDISGNKHVIITCDKDSDPIFVRIRAYASEAIFDLLEYDFEEGKWVDTGDGWYEYTDVLMAGESAVMDIKIDTTVIENSQFNVVVVYEYIPAIADGNGGYIKDWDANWTGGGD